MSNFTVKTKHQGPAAVTHQRDSGQGALRFPDQKICSTDFFAGPDGKVLRVCDATDEESARHGKSELQRIVSILIQETRKVSERSIKYEYRDAEYEYEYAPDRIAESWRGVAGNGAGGRG